MEQPKGVDWTVIILTCQYKNSVEVFQRELEVRQKREQIPARTLLLAVEDPETRMGSGGATLNALLVAAEHLSAREGFTVVTSDVLHSAWILILHMVSKMLGGALVCVAQLVGTSSHSPEGCWFNLAHA
uniref:Uncharacterized protein n=1 Tax=Molossus molossus TaxID=27622 RepID=A0A7J8C7G8_MOLMO|nr:hypothetical protein HJG59_005367 [Molossus molossus]